VLVLVVHRHDRHLHPCLLGVQENRERWSGNQFQLDDMQAEIDQAKARLLELLSAP
jgi:hypothetical protein